jgi:hypothetical protein
MTFYVEVCKPGVDPQPYITVPSRDLMGGPKGLRYSVKGPVLSVDGQDMANKVIVALQSCW